jgi:hypothetical protein
MEAEDYLNGAGVAVGEESASEAAVGVHDNAAGAAGADRLDPLALAEPRRVELGNGVGCVWAVGGQEFTQGIAIVDAAHGELGAGVFPATG